MGARARVCVCVIYTTESELKGISEAILPKPYPIPKSSHVHSFAVWLGT